MILFLFILQSVLNKKLSLWTEPNPYTTVIIQTRVTVTVTCEVISVGMVRSGTGRTMKKVTFISISVLKRSSSIPIANVIDVNNSGWKTTGHRLA